MTDVDALALTWQSSDTTEAASANAATVKALNSMIKAGDRTQVIGTLDRWPAAHMLAAFTRIRSKRAQRLLEWLPEDTSLRLLSELDPQLQAVLVDEHTQARFKKLMRKFPFASALRLLRELPADMAEALLSDREDAAALRGELSHHWDTAAAHVQFGSLVLPMEWTIGEVVEDIRQRSDQIDKIDAVHVVDANQTLVGYLRIRDLLLHDNSVRVGDVMRPDPIHVAAETDREEVLAMARSRKLAALAVVDGQGRLLGAITRKELEEIARKEAEEDMLLMGNVSPASRGDDSVGQIIWRRLPWLVTGLFGAMLTAMVIGSYEATLTQAAILASFIPVVSATAGNASMQASTISIQALSGETTWRGDFLQRLMREFGAASVNGCVMAAVVGALILGTSFFVEIDQPWLLALSVSLAQFLVIIVAGTLGTLVPVLLHRMNMDPSAATGIFILTANDVFGVLILFLTATLIYL